MKTKVYTFLSAFLFFIIGTVPVSAVTIPGTCGMVIDAPGDYELGNDIIGCPGRGGLGIQYAIKIQADGVCLNLNGYTISGTGSAYGVYVAGSSNVTVEGPGRIENFNTGIFIGCRYDYESGISLSSNSSTIKGISISGNSFGIFFDWAHSGLTYSDNTLDNNIIVLNSQIGIDLNDFMDGTISNNTVSGGYYGIALKNSNENTITKNRVTENAYGILLVVGSSNNEIYENAICYNTEYGLDLACDAHYNHIYYNNFLDNEKHAADFDYDYKSNNWEYNYWSGHDCSNPYLIYCCAQSKDYHPLCEPWPDARSCEGEENTGSICGFKFNDVNRDGEWTISDSDTIRLDDEFDDCSMDDWETFRGNWEENEGYLKQNDHLASEAIALYSLTDGSRDEAKGYTVFSFRTLAMPRADDGDFGVVFFAKDENDFYLFGVDGNGDGPRKPRIGIFHYYDGSYHEVVNMPFSNFGFPYNTYAIDNSQIYGFKVDARVDGIKFYFDKDDKFDKPGEWEVFDIPRDTFGCFSGYYGLWASNTEVWFDQVYDSAEPALSGWEIKLDGPVSGETTTNPDGSYCFENLPSGEYMLSETTKEGWVQTYPVPPGSQVIDLEAGSFVGCVNFGNSTEVMNLYVSKTVVPLWTRTYDWSVTKSVAPDSLQLAQGENATVRYTISTYRFVVGDNYSVSGTISAQNTGENTAIMKDVKDCIEYKGSVPGSEPDGFTTLKCEVVQIGGTIDKGATATWNYRVGFEPVPDATAYRNRAEVTILDQQEGEYPFIYRASFDFSSKPNAEVDAEANVMDIQTCPDGFTCSPEDAGPWNISNSLGFSFIKTVQNISAPYDTYYDLDNTVILEEKDTEEQRIDSASIVIYTGLSSNIIQPGDFCTYTQGGWSSRPRGNNPGKILANNFDKVYLGGFVEVGIPEDDGNSMIFTSAKAIELYLPAGGRPNSLTRDYTNPQRTSSGVFGGQVLALQLNVDFSAAGITQGEGGPLGNLKLCHTDTSLDGETVDEILSIANRVLGGGSLPAGYTCPFLNNLVTNLNEAFNECNPSSWAQKYLCY